MSQPFEIDLSLTHPLHLKARLHDDPQVRPALLILPGGSYFHVVRHEQDAVVDRFFPLGYQCFVATAYAVRKASRGLAPLEDAGRMVAHLRAHAGAYRLDPDRIIVLGFSAGGHMAALLGNHWTDTAYWAERGLSPEAVKPNAQVLAYPFLNYSGMETVIGPILEGLKTKLPRPLHGLFGPSKAGTPPARQGFPKLLGMTEAKWRKLRPLLEWRPLARYLAVGSILLETEEPRILVTEQVTATTPPTYLWHSLGDRFVPCIQSEEMAHALRAQGIPHVLRLYETGHHGCSVEALSPELASWPEAVDAWIRETLGRSSEEA